MAEDSLRAASAAFSEHSTLVNAGIEYMQTLIALGSSPEIMCWALFTDSPEMTEASMQLVIVDSWFDRIGPTAIYEALFKAYDASVTPKEVNPFIVSVFSPKSEFAIDLRNALRNIDVPRTHNGRAVEREHMIYVVGSKRPVLVAGAYVLKSPDRKGTAIDDMRAWERFKTEIDRRAA